VGERCLPAPLRVAAPFVDSPLVPPLRDISLSVVMVNHNEGEVAANAAREIARQLRPGDEIVVYDNASSDGTPDLVSAAAPAANVIRGDENLGFTGACNRAAAAASGELLLFLNPDTRPAPGFCDAIRRPLEEERGWSAWQGLVTQDDGRHVNTAGNVMHFTGISWTGMYGEPVERVPDEPREIAIVSGACLAIPRELWVAHDGFPERFFMYCEDVDLSLRLRLEGGVLGIEPTALLDHLYDFDKGVVPKWELLERNRWATVLRIYPGPLLALTLPALILAELPLLAAALASGWGGDKLRAMTAVLKDLPRTLAERRAIQAKPRASSAEFARTVTAELSSPILGAVGRVRIVNAALGLYWRVVRAALG
jgi:GT2 family glycosyltransferase